MSYYLSRTVSLSFQEAIDAITTNLKDVGFGILTEIDMTATLKNKLDVDIAPYKILGACNPNFAHQGLQYEPNIGTLLPCNVTVRDNGNGTCEVCIIDPIAMVSVTNNPELAPFATDVKATLQGALDSLPVLA